MAMHNTNGILKYIIPIVIILLVTASVLSCSGNSTPKAVNKSHDNTAKNVASNDSAAESLDTLTAELSTTKKQIEQINKDNNTLKQQNSDLLQKLQSNENSSTAAIAAEVEQLKNQLQSPKQKDNGYTINTASVSQVITTVPDLTPAPKNAAPNSPFNLFADNKNVSMIAVNSASNDKKVKFIPYYTIPPNATAVHDRLMTALVGRIPVKGVVTDPYPFKIVFSDDTLAANGLRIPNLRQMIVSGYCEGDLMLRGVRGWVTSLTFVFNDGAISTTTSNDNDIGHFTKENALGYLSDKYGNPLILGKLYSNAPEYLGGNVLLGAAKGAADAFSQEQLTNQTSALGSSTSTVTGSPGKFLLGQAGSNAANEAQQWWHDRQAQSFDVIYVPTVDDNGNPIEVTVNFSKEIDIDYNPNGRKIFYAHATINNIRNQLD